MYVELAEKLTFVSVLNMDSLRLKLNRQKRTKKKKNSNKINTKCARVRLDE